jgi:rubrerythrin
MRKVAARMMNMLNSVLERDRHPYGVLSLIFSNFEQVCRKQRRPNQAKIFSALSTSFEIQAKRRTADHTDISSLDRLLERFEDVIDEDLNKNYQECTAASSKLKERGSLRASTWGKKVTAIQRSLIRRFNKQGADFIPVHQKIHVCEACGFIMIGEEPPPYCPVCRAPAGRFVSVTAGKGN